jgi:enoyl-CoA hydratase
MSGRHGNAINGDLLQGLRDGFALAENDREAGAVLLASGGKLFSPGLDLQELMDLDRTAMDDFLELFDRTLLSLFTFPKPVVGALSGHAVAGGCVLAVTADWRILAQGARIGLNEVQVGVPLPYPVVMLLRETANRPFVPEIALLGRNYQDRQAVQAGLAQEIHPNEGFHEHCLARAAEYASRDPAALAITKRYARSVAVEGIRVSGAAHRREFLDCWFSAGTRERIAGIVAGLRKGKF